jgi:hypothetical protein
MLHEMTLGPRSGKRYCINCLAYETQDPFPQVCVPLKPGEFREVSGEQYTDIIEAGITPARSDFTKALGPIRIDAMSDARALAWFDVTKVPPPLDRVIWIAKPKLRVAGLPRAWFLARVKWGSTLWVDPEDMAVRYSAKDVTHWHEDTMGVPALAKGPATR